MARIRRKYDTLPEGMFNQVDESQEIFDMSHFFYYRIQALLLTRSSHVADCVLLGMRREAYVREALLNIGARPDMDHASDTSRYDKLKQELQKIRERDKGSK